MPGRMRPISGPTTWEIPWKGSSRSKSRTPKRLVPGAHRPDEIDPVWIRLVVPADSARDGVVEDAEGEVGPPDLSARSGHPTEGLRRVELMQQVAVDVDEVLAIDALADEMRRPDLVDQGFRHR